jgi:hypothetical protein
MDLPRPRGPLSEAVHARLEGRPHELPAVDAGLDVLSDDDLHLAL